MQPNPTQPTERAMRPTPEPRDLSVGLPGRPGSDALRSDFFSTGRVLQSSVPRQSSVPAVAQPSPVGPFHGPAFPGSRPMVPMFDPNRDRLEGLADVLPYGARGQAWEAWQGHDFDLSTGEVITHALRGNRPGERKPRTEEVVWCVAVRRVIRGREILCGVPGPVCPVHGTQAIRGCTLPAPIEDGRSLKPVVSVPSDFDGDRPIAWSDQSHRVNVRLARSRKTGRTVKITTRGEKLRPEPSERVMADGMKSWPVRLRAAAPDSGKVLAYRAPMLTDRAFGPAAIGVHSQGHSSDGGTFPDMAPLRGARLIGVLTAAGTLPKVKRKPSARTMAALLARDAAVSGVLARQDTALKPAVRKPSTTRAAAVSKAVTGRKPRQAGKRQPSRKLATVTL